MSFRVFNKVKLVRKLILLKIKKYLSFRTSSAPFKIYFTSAWKALLSLSLSFSLFFIYLSISYTIPNTYTHASLPRKRFLGTPIFNSAIRLSLYTFLSHIQSHYLPRYNSSLSNTLYTYLHFSLHGPTQKLFVSHWLIQCDQNRWNFVTLAKFVNLWPFQKVYLAFGKKFNLRRQLSKFSLLQMAKYWTHDRANWSHWLLNTILNTCTNLSPSHIPTSVTEIGEILPLWQNCKSLWLFFASFF